MVVDWVEPLAQGRGILPIHDANGAPQRIGLCEAVDAAGSHHAHAGTGAAGVEMPGGR